MSFLRGRHLVLMGLPGAGKTTVGRAVAEGLGRPYLDSDDHIEALLGESGRRMAAREGVEALHQAEAEALRIALGSERPAVVAAAASVADLPDLAEVVGEAVVVVLEGTLDVLATRQAGGTHRRRFQRGELEDLARRRRPIYAGMAHLVIDTSVVPADRAVAVVLALAG